MSTNTPATQAPKTSNPTTKPTTQPTKQQPGTATRPAQPQPGGTSGEQPKSN